MSRAVQKQKIKKPRHSVASKPSVAPPLPAVSRIPWRAVCLALAIFALVYAFLAGFRTVSDTDTGFHLATGRYVVEHHVVPSTDVLSYTAAGKEWLYPPFGDVLLYGIFSAGGYAGLTWFCALMLAVIIACLLRSPVRPESGLAAALAILAVPLLAPRVNPRPDLITHLFFAIFLAVLWRFYCGNPGVSSSQEAAPLRAERLRLWILPPLMLLWVNLHPGFAAGLGLLFAYLLIEGLDLLFPARRNAARRRLQLAWPALIATVVVTVINPYGFRIFKAPLLISNLQGANLPSTGVDEWQAIPLSSLSSAFDWRDPTSSYWWLALVAIGIIVLALLRRQFGIALLVGAALFASQQHQRLAGMFSIVAVVVGSSILTDAFTRQGLDGAGVGARRLSFPGWAAAIAVILLCLVTSVRAVDLISNRFYHSQTSMSQFGAGESWWFPERAAEFIQREHLPGNLFQTYELGGFTTWRLGPQYGDYIDGRFDHLAPAVMIEAQNLIASPPDSPLWKSVVDSRGINVLLLPLARVSGLQPPLLMSLCQSREWRPVYMDDVSIVLLRNRPENRRWIDGNEVDCQTHSFTPPHGSRVDLANFYANSGYILQQIGRLSEAMDALNSGAQIAPEDPSNHTLLGGLYEAQRQLEDAEREYKTALSIDHNNPLTLYCLARVYVSLGRLDEARPLLAKAIELSANQANYYTLLGTIDVDTGHLQLGLADFAKAEEIGAVYLKGREDLAPELYAQIAAGRAAVYAQQGDLQRAIQFEQQATQKTPEHAGRWEALGNYYSRAGQLELAQQAHQRAMSLAR